MAITVTQLTQGNLRLSLGPAGAGAPNPEAWKKLMGNKPISARLDTLPEGRPRWSALLTSTIFQAVLAAFLVAIPMFFPDKLVTKIEYEVVPLAAPQTEVQLPPKRPVMRAKALPTPPPVVQPPPPQHVAQLIAPRPLVALRPKPREVAEVKVPEEPRLNEALTETKFEAPPEPVRPREPVKIGNLTTGSAALATISKPIDQVQTGGFGDPNGLPGNSNPNKRANIAHFGSPALPPGPGYGNGTGGAHGVRGTVASAGFGNGVAIVPSSSGSGAAHSVKSGGFETAAVASEAPKPKPVERAAAVQPVVILDKPKPVYSGEARKLGIEGEVLVAVVFPASGPVRVIRVTKGLGHGLDEAAVRAAEQIRFEPALQDGKPVDFPATVHIEFQLAF
jgi:TonB family protein